MTDKEKVREEIEKIKTVHSSVGLKESNPDVLVVQVCTNLLSFIDSLQEEPVSEEFEDEWKRYCESKGGGAITVNIKKLARHFAEWQKQQMINKAVDWLKSNIDCSMWILEFRKHLEE